MTRRIRVRHRTRPPTATPSPENEIGAETAATAKTASEAYEVGYRKPPKSGQFKLGQSGNPKGRPKGTKNLKTDLAEELQERILVREGGKARHVSKQRAMLKRLSEKALQGDMRASALIVNMVARFFDHSDDDTEGFSLDRDDLEILKSFEAQVRTSSLKSQPSK